MIRRGVLCVLAFVLALCCASDIPQAVISPALMLHASPAASAWPVSSLPGEGGHPTLADFWDGRAEFVMDVQNTGLPMGESDTLVMSNGEWWSYLHASAQSAGAADRCGQPVEFPGCVVIYRSHDSGHTFQHDEPLVCQFDCRQCPCDSARDHVDQQQYPRVYTEGQFWVLAYEYRARVMLRYSRDGLHWSPPYEVPGSGVRQSGLASCRPEERIGRHPYAAHIYDCLAGAPPGLYLEGNHLYVFTGLGQNPGAMGCYWGGLGGALARCKYTPLFRGAGEYGPFDDESAASNPFFDFRTVSSAEVQKVGNRYYMLYEGTRGPGPGDPGDSQFGLGLARSLTDQLDGPWAKFAGNPILVDLPGNIGLGHADLVVANGQTYLYTSLDGRTRSRLMLKFK